MPTVITNRDLVDAVLPEPFSVALKPLGSVIYEGTSSEVFDRAPSIQGRFTVREIDASDSLPLPGLRNLALTDEGRAAVAVIGLNICAPPTTPVTSAFPEITPAVLGKTVMLQRITGLTNEPEFSSVNGFQLLGGGSVSPTYTFTDTFSFVEFTAIQVGAGRAWLLTKSVVVD